MNDDREDMPAEAKHEMANGVKLVNGKVYLRDTRNGTVHDYQPLLAEMNYITRFVHGEKEAPAYVGEVAVSAESTAAQRAVEWDRQAAAKPSEQPTAEQVATAETAQREQDEALAAAQGKKKYKPTAKAEGFDIKKDFMDKGWTKEALIAEGYIAEVNE